MPYAEPEILGEPTVLGPTPQRPNSVNVVALEQLCDLDHQCDQEDEDISRGNAQQRRLARQMLYMYQLLKQGCAIKLTQDDEIEIVHNWDPFPQVEEREIS